MIAAVPRWSVHLPTVDETSIRLAVPVAGERTPWAAARALAVLTAAGARPAERADALGGGRGTPVLARHRLLWGRLSVVVESWHHGDGGRDELALLLPPWDELVEQDEVGEEDLWALVDEVAAGVDALHGAVGDGRGLEAAPADGPAARLRRHVGLLLPEGEAAAVGSAGCLYRRLPRCGLDLVLR